VHLKTLAEHLQPEGDDHEAELLGERPDQPLVLRVLEL